MNKTENELTNIRDEYTSSICDGCNGHGFRMFRNGGDEECSECDGEGMTYRKKGRLND